MVLAFSVGLAVTLTAVGFADEPKPPSAESVRGLQAAYTQERQQADESGASRIVAPTVLRRAEDFARQADAVSRP